jgi:DNA-binding NarL/FixJ family response regulator
MAITDPDPELRRRLGQVGTAAGFEVSYPGDPVDWAQRHKGVALTAVLTRRELVVLKQLRTANSLLTIIALMGCAARHVGYAALRVGANAVVDRSTDPREILLTARLAQRGNALLPTRLLQELVRRHPARAIDCEVDLETTDLELLQDLAEGATIQRIARHRHQATRTVERRLQRLYAQIGAGNRVEAVAKAAQWGLIRISA